MSVRDQLHVCDAHGNTPLHHAARLDLPNHVQSYLQCGANARAKNFDGETPLDLAIGRECKLLLRFGIRRGRYVDKPRTVVLYGNTNNYPLLLAKAFVAMGQNVRLVVTRGDARHRPESKYPTWNGRYPSWIGDCSQYPDIELSAVSTRVVDRLAALGAGADLVILNDLGPALSRYFPRPQVVFLTGSDLTYYGDSRFHELISSGWSREFKESPQGQDELSKYSQLVSNQQAGIRDAALVSFAHRGLIREGDELLDSIGVRDADRIFLMLADIDSLHASPLPTDRTLRILNGARVEWKQLPDCSLSGQDLKGTDVLLRGFAQYSWHGGTGKLCLIEKGRDVQAAKRLIQGLSIERRVEWIGGEMSLDRYLNEVRKSHVVCDQLGQTSFPGMVTFDAYALGRPVLANFRNDIFSQHLPEPMPGFDAAKPSDVADHLFAIEKDRRALQFMAQKSRKYAETYLAPDVAAVDLLERVVRLEPEQEGTYV